MSGNIPALPPTTAVTYPKPASPAPASSAAAGSVPHPAERHPTPALSPADISYVDGLMGIAPAQTLEYILLKTGIPMPENLGNDIDTSA